MGYPEISPLFLSKKSFFIHCENVTKGEKKPSVPYFMVQPISQEKGRQVVKNVHYACAFLQYFLEGYKKCAEIELNWNPAMSRTWMTTRNNADEMGSGEKFDAVQSVKDNYNDYEDGWGVNLMNLEEITGEEITDENMKEIIPKLLSETDKKKKIMMMKKPGEQKATNTNDEKGNKEGKERCREEMRMVSCC